MSIAVAETGSECFCSDHPYTHIYTYDKEGTATPTQGGGIERLVEVRPCFVQEEDEVGARRLARGPLQGV